MQTAAHSRCVCVCCSGPVQVAGAHRSSACLLHCTDVLARTILQASLTAKLAGRYGSAVHVQKSGALLLAGAAPVSAQLQLDSYGQLIGCALMSLLRPSAYTGQADAASATYQTCLRTATCRAASITARNATFVCVKKGEVCGDRGCNDESLLAGLSLVPCDGAPIVSLNCTHLPVLVASEHNLSDPRHWRVVEVQLAQQA
jgi:hypothetical protein